MKRLVLDKNLFTRIKCWDCTMHYGTRYRFYYYRDKLPILVAHDCGAVFMEIAFRLLPYGAEQIETDYAMGVKDEDFDMADFIKTCDELYQRVH